MKDKVLYLVIGILIGAIITTGVFMILNKNNNRGNFDRGRIFDQNNMPEGFDFNNLPEGFDVNNIRQGGPRGGRQIDQTDTDSL